MPSWTLPITRLDPSTLRITPLVDGRRVSLEGFFAALAEPGLGDQLTATLAAAPFAAFCVEFPALTATPRDAEFVIVDSPALARSKPDASPFEDAFRGHTGAIHTFPNLGGDAQLVVPSPRVVSAGTHIAEFLRAGKFTRELWSAVSAAIGAYAPRPLWVSTAGLGVSWLHVRLGRAPKYYRHSPYMR